MNKAFLILILSTFGTTVFSQSIQWQNTIGGSSLDYLQSIRQTADGGYIAAGYSSSTISGDKTENNIGYYNYWVLKLDSAGSITWQNTIGGSNTDQLYCVRQTPDHGYILGGFSNSDSSGDKTENNQGFRDYWIVKLDSTGNIQWQNTIGGSDQDYLRSIEPTSDGGFIVGGTSFSGISGDKTDSSRGATDFWIVKLRSNGIIDWQKTIGGNNSDDLQDIEETVDGGYILGGTSDSDSSGEKTENSIGNTDYWIVRLDETGRIVWQNTIGGSSPDLLAAIHQTSDSGYVAAGTSSSGISGDKTEGNIGSQDYWVLKLDSAGAILWQNTIGGSSMDDLTAAEQTSDGNYIIGGYSSSYANGDKTENNIGVEDYWVLKLDANGNILWQNTIGGTQSDQLTSLQQTLDGGFILAGTSSSNISGDKSENSQGFSDYWVVKIGDTVFTTGNIPPSLSSGIEIFPNPVCDGLTVSHAGCGNEGPMAVSIYDVEGAKIFSADFLNCPTIDCGALASGLYVLELINGRQVARCKFLKE